MTPTATTIKFLMSASFAGRRHFFRFGARAGAERRGTQAKCAAFSLRSHRRRPIGIRALFKTALRPLRVTGKLAILHFWAFLSRGADERLYYVQVRVRCCCVLACNRQARGRPCLPPPIRLWFAFVRAWRVLRGGSIRGSELAARLCRPARQAPGSRSGEGKRPAAGQPSSPGRARRRSGRACIACCS